MKILFIHNEYAQKGGGENQVVDSEIRLLKENGHEVVSFIRSNYDVLEKGKKNAFRSLLHVKFNKKIYTELRQFCEKEKPDVAHVHNFWFALSPSVYQACYDVNVPVIQTLHNFRTLCLNALLLRKGKPCEKCVEHSSLKGIFLRCYHRSFLHSWFVYRMQKGFQKVIHIPTTFIALTEHGKEIFIRAGFPKDKVVVKPNFVPDCFGEKTNIPHKYKALFIGALMEHKGVRTLLKAWKKLPKVELTIIGDGDLREEMKSFCTQNQLKNIIFRGYLNHAEIAEELLNTSFLIMPSECYETFGLSVIESFSAGKPVIASSIGALKVLIEAKKTGLLFKPGDVSELVSCVKEILNQEELIRMGENARKEYEEKFSTTAGYRNLIEIYNQAIKSRGIQ